MTEEKAQEQGNVEETIEEDYKKNIMNIFYSVKPIYYVQRFFGMLVYSVDNGKIITPSWQLKVLIMSCTLLYCVLFFWSLRLPTAVTGTMNMVDVIDEIPGLVTIFQYVITVITSAFLLDATSIKIIQSFAELDSLLRVETIHDFYKKSRAESIRYLIYLLILHTVNCVADLVTATEFSMSSLVMIPLYFFQKFQILVFRKVIIMLKCRLNLINDYLTTFIEDQDRKHITIFTIRDTKVIPETKLNFIGRASETNVKIRDLALIYNLMGKISSLINEAWNFQIFMTLVSTFVFIIITIWTSLYYYKTPENYSGPLINISIWCLSALYTVAVMSLTCERLLLVRNETRVLVNKVIMNYDLPKTMRVQAKAFMELIEAWPLRIYIYDMFSVDITLMLKFISVATTYLIVIIQISHFF